MIPKEIYRVIKNRKDARISRQKKKEAKEEVEEDYDFLMKQNSTLK